MLYLNEKKSQCIRLLAAFHFALNFFADGSMDSQMGGQMDNHRDYLRNGEFKAVFLDYTGTMVREDEPYTMKLLEYFLTHSSLREPKRALSVVWGLIKKIENECRGDAFIGKDEMVDRILDICVKEYALQGDLPYMHDLWRHSWIHAPLFDDVKPFFEACLLPVYVVTNDDLCYIRQSLEEKQLTPAGVVAAEMVRACKPHREIFEEALKMAGVSPREAVHIGDSVVSDAEAARAVSITPILLDRKGTASQAEAGDARIIRTLLELV